ncbi:hypothetical protein KEM48_001430 [Puccinia striiformis f. sp. tritici PST-130]|uniref:Uncharacterized protein n=1 Tax=Puccinia striiformis f. sp. tritici PST-78 TaxID=1165861 RepID=A0A0L0V7K6_9BASI|nr:hypothetical protein KEM48_001430 [Puccinia striiformis f. sp. tritici PST-130]KNE95171.1 hypothetical protein PSTG_11537 [Puccinia striiformis f. sp. tritici PST-78]
MVQCADSPSVPYLSCYYSMCDPSGQNWCWLAAGLESLYSTLSPLLDNHQQFKTNKSSDLFNLLVQHFRSRRKLELKDEDQLQKVLEGGFDVTFDQIHRLSPKSFPVGQLAVYM